MRCEDCLPLIEEYFDGEVEERSALKMRAHLSMCATCAAALDALSFEQEIYARYDRELEVAPALWSRISAEIAREPQPGNPAEGHPFLSRLRDRLAATLGAHNLRPAFAASLALLFVAIVAGALWLAYVRRPAAANNELAANVPDNSVPVKPISAAPVRSGDVAPFAVIPDEGPFAESVGHQNEGLQGRMGVRAGELKIIPAAGARTPDEDVMQVLARASMPQANGNTIVIKADEHSGQGTDPTIFVNTASADRSVATSDARMLDSGDEALARHVEQTQMLLRSFKNARPAAADDDTVNVAYERRLSRKLLAENSTLQLDAETRGDKDTKRVLDSIEPFLLDIANLRDQPSREEVRSIKERVRKNEIIAALQVY
ncbi:MAG: hypothetical protein QOC99_1615 [Acidobacteriota bacterium]|jgi:hypothetical protein|nr:hypothetical protein [Acidobacteriota bacterium]MDT7779103.1 hypothetical protein [Acidobacteriota bacterium]